MATRTNLVIDQGTSFSSAESYIANNNSEITDFSTYSANAQLRRWYTSSNSVAFTAAINSNTGVVAISLTSNATANIESGRYVYDIVVRDSANAVTRIAEGIVTVTPRVTR